LEFARSSPLIEPQTQKPGSPKDRTVDPVLTRWWLANDDSKRAWPPRLNRIKLLPFPAHSETEKVVNLTSFHQLPRFAKSRAQGQSQKELGATKNGLWALFLKGKNGIFMVSKQTP